MSAEHVLWQPGGVGKCPQSGQRDQDSGMACEGSHTNLVMHNAENNEEDTGIDIPGCCLAMKKLFPSCHVVYGV